MSRVAVENSLLAGLPKREYQRLLLRFKPVPLTFGQVLYEPGKPIRHVYFPIDCLISLLTTAESHRALEVALVGHEGMVGIPLALGINVSPTRAVVSGTGMALRTTSGRFCSEHWKHGALHKVLDRYIHRRIVHITQSAACIRFHLLEGRLARWLLMMRDRKGTDHFRHTQQVIANRLGVRREGVTEAAGRLQAAKLIRWRRGQISIVDGKGLEAAACHCYLSSKTSP